MKPRKKGILTAARLERLYDCLKKVCSPYGKSNK